MSTLAELQRQIPLLTTLEQSQLLRWIVLELSHNVPGVESNKGVCGGEPCIVRTRIPVWVLEQLRRHGASDVEILANFPTLRAEDLANAWMYVNKFQQDVESQIADNEEA